MNKCFSALMMAATVILLGGCAGLMDKDNTPTPARLTPLPATAKPVKVVWRTYTGTGAGPEFPGLTPVIQGDRIFTASRNGQITALDRRNGKIIWQTGTALPISAGIAVNERQVFAGTRYGKLIALDQATGKTLWTAEAPSQILAPPAANSSRVIVKSIDNHITAFSTQSGKKLWSAFEKQPELILNAAGSPRISGSSVFAGYEDGTLARYSLNHGGLTWKQTIADPNGIFPIQRMVDVTSTPAVASYHVFAATWQGRIASVNLEDGSIDWSQPVSAYSSPVYDGSAVYLSDAKGYIHAFDPENGRQLWKQEALFARRLTTPTTDGRYLILGDAEGWVHWFDKNNGQLMTRYHAGGGGVYAAPLISHHTAYVATQNGQLIACQVKV